MTTTFQKRQKEMKRLDKQRAKQEKRAQRKLEKRAEKDAPSDNVTADITPNSESRNPQSADPQGRAGCRSYRRHCRRCQRVAGVSRIRILVRVAASGHQSGHQERRNPNIANLQFAHQLLLFTQCKAFRASTREAGNVRERTGIYVFNDLESVS